VDLGQISVKQVTEWPGQEARKEEAKVPSIVWCVAFFYQPTKSPTARRLIPYLRPHRYDHSGARSFGAEALGAKARSQAEKEHWQLAEHFKLHLHPASMRAKNSIDVPPLPNGISLSTIYADFLRYLFEHTRVFFQLHEIDGAKVWERLTGMNRIEVVLAHPNGWMEVEQTFLRQAAVNAGMASKMDTVHIVNEAEASVHFLMFQEGMASSLKVRHRLLMKRGLSGPANLLHPI
jgi:hypothetical protein